MPFVNKNSHIIQMGMEKKFNQWRAEVTNELQRILRYWAAYAPDERNGGFNGRVGEQNEIDEKAEKGSVLNSRILWTYSAVFLYTKDPVHLRMADTAFQYFRTHFIDPAYGGVYWSLQYSGAPADTRKHVYAQAFAVYGLSEYYQASGNPQALDLALELYRLIENYSFDQAHGGYIDAFAQDWSPMENIRLSAKDENEKKTMNTHLHIVEAYANLYLVWPDEALKRRTADLLGYFFKYIIDKETGHLRLFFAEDWSPRSALVSFGHDIEAAWLLEEAARTIDNADLITRAQQNAVTMARAATKGLDKDGGLWYEYEPSTRELIKEKHWWPQAEAMVGFLNAWQISRDEFFLEASVNNWKFTQRHIIDRLNGEWHWGVRGDYSLMPGQDKIGIWKCPYHNTRACLELLRRIPQA